MQPAGSASADQDSIFNYASTFLMSLLKANFNDAVKEMDGQRLLRCWKLVMLCYKKVGRTEYVLESLYLQDEQYSLLSPQEAYRLLHNRGINLKCGCGKNVPLDLKVEHVNNLIKDLCQFDV